MYLHTYYIVVHFEKQVGSFVIEMAMVVQSPEKIVVLASNDGDQLKMHFHSECKWRASFFPESPYSEFDDYSFSSAFDPTRCTSFEVIIDLTPEAILSVKKGKKHVLDYISNLWENKTLSDVTIKCDEKTIEAHTLILASGSPVLAAMFHNDFKENRERVVEIRDLNHQVVESLVRYIYTGDVDLENEDAADLMVAADKYEVDSLKEECTLFLSNNVTIDNASRYLVLSHLHNSIILQRATLKFMSKNAHAICCQEDWLEVIKNYPELSFTAMQNMTKK